MRLASRPYAQWRTKTWIHISPHYWPLSYSTGHEGALDSHEDRYELQLLKSPDVEQGMALRERSGTLRLVGRRKKGPTEDVASNTLRVVGLLPNPVTRLYRSS